MNSSGSRRSQRSNVARSSRFSTSQQPGYHQLSGQVQVVDGQSVAQSFVDQTLSHEPGCGPAVELGHPRRTHLGQQSALEQLLEQVVITIPLPLAVQGNHKEVIILQPLNAGLNVARGSLLPAIAAEDVFAQRGAEPVQDGGRQQESQDCRRLTGHNFVHQIVGKLDMGAR